MKRTKRTAVVRSTTPKGNSRYAEKKAAQRKGLFNDTSPLVAHSTRLTTIKETGHQVYMVVSKGTE